MKRWMLLGFAIQVFDVLTLLALLVQGASGGSSTLFTISFIAGFPGNVLGEWIAERALFHTSVSINSVSLVGMSLGICINLLLWLIIGYLFVYLIQAASRH
jgi:hypothetical protein